MVESEVKALRLENSYLKDLILIANDNYEKVEDKNRTLLEKYAQLEQDSHKREVEMLRKTEEIKNMFAAIVVDKNEAKENQKPKGEGAPSHSTVPGCLGKGTRKEQAEDAYRSIFMKTLKPRKENIHKQI